MYFQDELSNVMDVLHAQGVTMELSECLDDVNQDVTTAKRPVMIDGEIYEVESPTFQIWYS